MRKPLRADTPAPLESCLFALVRVVSRRRNFSRRAPLGRRSECALRKSRAQCVALARQTRGVFVPRIGQLRRGAEGVAVVAEVGVGAQYGGKLAQQHFEHDRIVEQADHFDVVGNQVFRIAEVDQSASMKPSLNLLGAAARADECFGETRDVAGFEFYGDAHEKKD